MKILKHLAVIIFVLIAVESTAQYEDAFKLIDAWIDAQREYDQLPGLTVGVVKDQQVIWSKGYGAAELKKNVPATPATVFSICSISKLFTSVAIMQLYDQGKLRLDDSVSMHLPKYNLKQQYKLSGPVTIRSLLTHSSGLPRESDYPYWTGPDFPFPTQQQVSEKLGAQQTLYPSSTYFQYSNLGMTLLGEIVEKVSGKPYDVYVEENILKPLRLADTHPSLPVAQWGTKMAVGYGAIKRDRTRDQIALFDAKGIKAAAGYASNVDDLAKFASWQFRLLESGKTEILKSSTLKEMQRVHWIDPDWKTTWGLGFSVTQSGDKTIVGHGGSCPGYRTTLQLDPKEKMAYVVMINAGGDSPERFATQIRNILAKAAKEKAPKTDSLNLQQYAGRYNSQPWSSETQVLPWYGKLAVISFPVNSPADAIGYLKHVKGDTFRRVRSDDTLGEEVVFEKDKSGKIVGYRQHSNNYGRTK
ncbi:MAG TPA: serine hydrolase [Cyclobacteriaceae bacterium]|nr:serine hydrolase [Cyclobacteriaceae bacterium]